MTDDQIQKENAIMSTENLALLIDGMRRIDGVQQVRWWPALRTKVKEVADDNAVSINCYMHLYGDTSIDRYVQLSKVYPSTVWNDPTTHSLAVSAMRDSVKLYLETGTLSNNGYVV